MQNFQNLKYIWIDGQIKKIEECSIDVLNHCMHYGTGAFEGIRVYNGKIFKAKEHFLRLFASANTMQMKLNYSIDQLIQATEEVLEKNQLKNAYVRPLAFRGNGSLRINAENQPSVMIAAWELQKYFHGDKEQKPGVHLGISNFKKPSSEFLPFNAKISGLYSLNHIMRVNSKECDDVIMLDWRDYVAECTTSNIFIVKNNCVYTPIADCFLNGITRKSVIEICHENQISCQETRLTIKDLIQADEIFITGTAIEIMPVLSINTEQQKKIFNPHENSITSKIQNLYNTLTQL